MVEKQLGIDPTHQGGALTQQKDSNLNLSLTSNKEDPVTTKKKIRKEKWITCHAMDKSERMSAESVIPDLSKETSSIDNPLNQSGEIMERHTITSNPAVVVKPIILPKKKIKERWVLKLINRQTSH